MKTPRVPIYRDEEQGGKKADGRNAKPIGFYFPDLYTFEKKVKRNVHYFWKHDGWATDIGIFNMLVACGCKYYHIICTESDGTKTQLWCDISTYAKNGFLVQDGKQICLKREHWRKSKV